MGKIFPGSLLLLAAAGCSTAVAVPEGTGAEEAARRFYEAILRKDWGVAFDLLDPETKRVSPAPRFAVLAQQYRRGMGFDPQEVRIRSCQERGAEATAHVVLLGSAGGQPRSYKDGLVLRRSDSGWSVVLPRNFGRPPLKQ